MSIVTKAWYHICAIIPSLYLRMLSCRITRARCLFAAAGARAASAAVAGGGTGAAAVTLHFDDWLLGGSGKGGFV
ncbi:hypothetical protein Micbo1qcDRAFT_156046, partial [Microdochium bolleyi]